VRWRGSLHRRSGLPVASGVPAGEGVTPSRGKAYWYPALGPGLTDHGTRPNSSTWAVCCLCGPHKQSPTRAQAEATGPDALIPFLPFACCADGQGRAPRRSNNAREEAQDQRGAHQEPLRRPGRRGRRRRRAGVPGRGVTATVPRRRPPREGDAQLRRRRRRLRGRQERAAAAEAEGRRVRGHHAGRPRPLDLPHLAAAGRRRGARRVRAPGAPVSARQGQLRARVRAEGVAPEQAPEGLHVRVVKLLFLTACSA
jgi:hypothetical protein